jgi:hypothetical protein
MSNDFIQKQFEEFLSSNYVSSIDVEEQIYKLLLSTRKFFHKGQDRVNFHQFWQQDKAFGDFEAVRRLLEGTPLFGQEDPKDKNNHNSVIILPKLDKAIVMNFRTILKSHYVRKDKGWVEYKEIEIN